MRKKNDNTFLQGLQEHLKTISRTVFNAEHKMLSQKFLSRNIRKVIFIVYSEFFIKFRKQIRSVEH